MSHVSGWCSGPDGARLKCADCKVPTCAHECHTDKKED